MKSSLDHLPKHKQAELKDIIKIIINAEKKIEMVILFGSYARGDFVDRDITTEDRMTYEYRSDFDMLVVVSDEEVAQDYGVWHKIKDTIRHDKSIQTPMRLLVEDIGFLNHKLAIGHYFYSDIKKEGIILYDSGRHTLAEAKELTEEEKRKIIQEDYEMWLKKAEEFLFGSEVHLKEEHNNLAAFNLHQATEALYTTILLVFTGYKPKTHDLEELEEEVAKIDEQFKYILPKDSNADKELFEVLNEAYVGARYRKDYSITKGELQTLMNRIKKLQQLVKKICQSKIKNS